MAKTQKDQDSKNSSSMLGQKTGTMLDKKTNEDFNNEHPDHNESGLVNDSSIRNDKNMGKDAKQTINIKKPETIVKKSKQ